MSTDHEVKEYETIIYEKTGRIASITLNRPDKHNAMNYQMLDDLDDVLDYAEDDESTNVLVLKANGKSFCSGFDLKGSYYITPPDGEWTYRNSYMILQKKIYSKYTRLFNYPKITIAQIHSRCTDGGCYLQLCCDISVAADEAQFGHPAQKWGGSVSTPLFHAYMGHRKARYFLMSGRLFDGTEAADMGLVSFSVPGAELEDEVNKLAAEIGDIPRDGALHNKITQNLAMKIQGVDAMFDYFAQMNRYSRFFGQEWKKDRVDL